MRSPLNLCNDGLEKPPVGRVMAKNFLFYDAALEAARGAGNHVDVAVLTVHGLEAARGAGISLTTSNSSRPFTSCRRAVMYGEPFMVRTAVYKLPVGPGTVQKKARTALALAFRAATA